MYSLFISSKQCKQANEDSGAKDLRKQRKSILPIHTPEECFAHFVSRTVSSQKGGKKKKEKEKDETDDHYYALMRRCMIAPRKSTATPFFTTMRPFSVFLFLFPLILGSDQSRRLAMSSGLKHSNVIVIHPDLGIGGAERLIIDVALALQSRGHRVTIYTSHRDKSHCFEEARNGTLDVRVRGNALFPAHVCGRLYVFMAVLRQLHLTWSVMKEMAIRDDRDGETAKKEGDQEEAEEKGEDDIFIVDQVPACLPVLKTLGPSAVAAAAAATGKKTDGIGKQRILFYCHFPDQLLSRRDQGGPVLRLLKGLYRYPFDWFEGWAVSAADKVVANSKFTKGVVRKVFGSEERLGDVSVVYPCVDTSSTLSSSLSAVTGRGDEDSGWEGINAKDMLWDGKKKILLSINRFERKKDMGLAVRAYYGLGEEGRKGTRLVIAGMILLTFAHPTAFGANTAAFSPGGYDNRVPENVQYHQELDSLAISLGLQTATSKTIISALSVPDSIDVLFLLSVPTVFRDILLSQSRLLLYTPVNEHFGIVPVEAMHAGIPVLASNTGGPLETIVENETGWLRDAQNIPEWTAVMHKVLYEVDQKGLDRISAAGKERAEKLFSLDAMGDKLETEILGMLNRPRRPFNGLDQVAFAVLILVGVGLSAIVWRMLKS